MRPLALSLAVALSAAAAPASAASVTLNGVPIDGVVNQKFENCTVVIDASGTVHIEAKGYAVQSSGGGSARTNGAPGTLSRRYFLVAEQTPPGPQYDVAIFINAQWIREVRSGEAQVVMEITKYLRPGPNKVTLAATKRIAGERLAFTKDVALRIVIGAGDMGGGNVMIEEPLVETVRTAVEIEDKTEEFVVDVR